MKKITRDADGKRRLEKEATALKNPYANGTPYDCIMSAEQNAADTCSELALNYRDNPEAYDAKYNECFWITLESTTTWDSTPKATREWFERRGIAG